MFRNIAWPGFLAGVVTILGLNALWANANPFLIQRLVTGMLAPSATPEQAQAVIWGVIMVLAALGGFVTFFIGCALAARLSSRSPVRNGRLAGTVLWFFYTGFYVVVSYVSSRNFALTISFAAVGAVFSALGIVLGANYGARKIQDTAP